MRPGMAVKMNGQLYICVYFARSMAIHPLAVLLAQLQAVPFWLCLFRHVDCAVLCRGGLAGLARLEQIQAPMGSQGRTI